MTSDYIKAALIQKLRFTNRCPYVATEVGPFCGDVCTISNGKLAEYEVKVSLSDFRADFNKPKHVMYRSIGNQESGVKTNWRNGWIPHLFWYAVPEEMVDAVGAKLLSYPGYGLIVVKKVSREWDLRIAPTTLIRAKPLHKFEIGQKVYQQFLYRMGSELAKGSALKLKVDNFKYE